MTDIRTSLESLASTIEELQNKPSDTVEIQDRELSGNKIHGGIITQFSSVGIRDRASDAVLKIDDNGIYVDVMHVDTINGDTSVKGNLNVDGEITASKIHVNELIADVRNERSDPLSFTGKGDAAAYGKGLLWPARDYTKQFLLLEKPDRFFASESIELRANKIYMINGQNVLSRDSLGTTVTKSNLQKLGTLSELTVNGNLNLNNYVYYDATNDRLGIGVETPNGALSIGSFDHEFIIDESEKGFKLGSYTNADLNLITDDTVRVTVNANGNVVIHKKLTVTDSLSIGVKNPVGDVSLTVGGPVRLEGKKFEVADQIPGSGNYTIGDIIWASTPTTHVGWICVRSGTPGEWKAFGQIAS